MLHTRAAADSAGGPTGLLATAVPAPPIRGITLRKGREVSGPSREDGVKTCISMSLIVFSAALLCLVFAGCDGGDDEEGVGLGVYGPGYIGPAEGYGSDFFVPGFGEGDEDEGDDEGDDDDPSTPRADIVAYRLHPTAGPVIDRFVLRLHNIDYTRNPFRVNSIGSSTFSARTSQQDINAFLDQRAQITNEGVRDIRMAFRPNQTTLTAVVNVNGVDTSVSSSGTLEPSGPTQVVYVPQTFTANDASVSQDVQQRVMDQVNPVVNLSGLRCSPTIQKITPGNGYVSISGPVVVRSVPAGAAGAIENPAGAGPTSAD